MDEFNAVVPSTRRDFLTADIEHACTDVHACDVHTQPHTHGLDGEVSRAGGHIEKCLRLLLAQDSNACFAPKHINAQ